MGEVVNLNQARKAKARENDKARAIANRAAHGRSRAERKQTEAEKARLSKHLDGAKLDE
jgi:hypothetical protein